MKKTSFKKWPLSIEPSMLSADFGHLAEEARRLEAMKVDALHIDVMDGHFVPNLGFSPKAVAAINQATDLFLDVHLMMYNPYDYIERFVEAGADRLTFHVEATEDVEDTLAFIRKCNIEAGLAFCPDTTASIIPKYLDQCDLILLMTVHPGFGGQAFIEKVLTKIKFTRQTIDRLNLRREGGDPFNIQVDGGITDKTAKLCVEAGANVLVAGTYLFEGKDTAAKVRVLRELG